MPCHFVWVVSYHILSERLMPSIRWKYLCYIALLNCVKMFPKNVCVPFWTICKGNFKLHNRKKPPPPHNTCLQSGKTPHLSKTFFVFNLKFLSFADWGLFPWIRNALLIKTLVFAVHQLVWEWASALLPAGHSTVVRCFGQWSLTNCSSLDSFIQQLLFFWVSSDCCVRLSFRTATIYLTSTSTT